ncbi:MAG: enoyl-CoA hydratase-related protein [bacterium]|nr:enoyl-CoA hydratase-related protein [bacterium]
MNYEQILYEMEGPVLRLTCNRPRYRNAQSRRLLEELDDAFARAADDLDVRVIVLMGAGDHFSGGHDLGTPEELADRQERPFQEGIRGRFQRTRELHVNMTLRWRNVPKPTIAVVQGYCIFGGWMIASAMDFIFAADDAMFLGANFQYFSIPWDIHPRKAKEILYASRFIDAPEALQLGLVNRVIPRQQLVAETMAYANLVAQNDPFQLRLIKMAVNQQQDGQGFAAHLTAAHTMHVLSAVGESDPDYALQKPEGRRRPMVQQAFENYAAQRK